MGENDLGLTEEQIRQSIWDAAEEKFKEFQEQRILLPMSDEEDGDEKLSCAMELAEHLDELLESLEQREDLTDAERARMLEIENELDEFEKYVRDRLQYPSN
jgi:hypothetical protein